MPTHSRNLLILALLAAVAPVSAQQLTAAPHQQQPPSGCPFAHAHASTAAGHHVAVAAPGGEPGGPVELSLYARRDAPDIFP